MANVEKSGYMKYKDKSGNMTTMYPKTKVANVEGLETALAGKENSGAAATALSNAKAYTDQKIAAIPTPESDIFWATYGTTTFEEVKAAYDAKKDVQVLYNGCIYRASSLVSSAAFTFIYASGSYLDTGVSYGFGVSNIIMLWKSQGWNGPYTLRYTPNGHASKHATDGEDPITPASIGAATMTEVNTAIQSAIQNTWEASY